MDLVKHNTLRKISPEEFSTIGVDNFMILSKFDPNGLSAIQPQDIIGLTEGDTTFSCTPRRINILDGINGVPDGLMEGVRIVGWDVKASMTVVTLTAQTIKMAIGAADISEDAITPRPDLSESDFMADFWIVGVKTDGSLIAADIKHALSNGLTINATKDGRGQMRLDISGHPSLSDSNPYGAPVVVYSTSGAYSPAKTMAE